MVYYSKRDAWLGILLLGSTGYSSIVTLFDLGISAISMLLVAIFGFCCWIWFGTYYKIEKEILFVHCGPFKNKVEIAKIKHIKDTRNPLSSPALSVDRIELRGDGVFIILSPKSKLEFINHLQEINSNIQYKN